MKSSGRVFSGGRYSVMAASSFAAVAAAILVANAGCTGQVPVPGNVDMTVRANDHVLSVGDPSVTVIEYSDFECGFCANFATGTFPALRQAYVDTGKVRWVFRHYPLHGNSQAAAEASECAADQGMFWEYHDLLFANNSALSEADLKSYAGQLGLDQATFDACLDGGGKAARVQEDADAAMAAGVPGTPTFFIDGQAQVGAPSLEDFSAFLDALVAAAEQ
jgi:protein-disulfide isomerase